MQKFQLQSTERLDQKVLLLHSGETEFNSEGLTVVEVSEEQVSEMVESYPDLKCVSYEHILTAEDLKANPELVEKGFKEGDPVFIPLEPQTDGEENDLGKGSEDEKNDIGGDEAGDIQGAGLAATLEALTAKDLKELAAKSEFPEADWAKLNKQELKAYLLSKLQPQA